MRGKRLWTVLAMLVALLMAALPAGARVEKTASAPAAITVAFDHFRTGFPLTGAHASVRCESCHRGGTFAGTPTDCASCHNDVIAIGKPSRHIRTQAKCDSCHTTRSWQIVRFDHAGTTASCKSCHDGAQTTGKPSGHIATAQDCAACHGTSSWAVHVVYHLL